MLRLKKNVILRSNVGVKLVQKKSQYSTQRGLFERFNKRLLYPNPLSKKPYVPEKVPTAPSVEMKIGPRVNKMNIQMLSKAIYNQVFKDVTPTSRPSSSLIDRCRKTLENHGMMNEMNLVEDVDFVLPPLEGKNLEEHFWNIAEEQAKPYKAIIEKLLESIPAIPEYWTMREGWTKYLPNCEPEAIDFPHEEGLVFDIEVCMQAGKAPTLATAVSNKAWYGWVSPSLVSGTSKPITYHHYMQDVLIPLESNKETNGHKLDNHLCKPKIVVGHNVSYDRARIKEQYWLKRTGLRFVDTMSLHTCVSGLTSYQRAILKSSKENPEDDEWKACSSLNSLAEVHKLYCGSTVDKETRNLFIEGSLSEIRSEFHSVMTYCAKDVVATYNVLKQLFPMFLERFPHPVTFAGMLELSTAYLPVNSNWIRYIDNSEQTYNDLDIEGRLLLARRADQACQLLHGEKYKEDLWMWDQDWEVKNLKLKSSKSKQKTAMEETDTTKKDENTLLVISEKNQAITEDKSDSIYNSLLNKRLQIKGLECKFDYLLKTKELLPKIKSLLSGYPNWYRKLCTKPDSSPDWIPGPHSISTSMQVTPKLLNLTWEGYPLHFIRGLGWGLLVPFSTDTDIERKLPLKQLLKKCPLLTDKPKEGTGDLSKIAQNVQDHLTRKDYYRRLKKDKTEGLYKGTGLWCETLIEDCCFFLKLPHKDGASHRVGNPLAKDFLNKFSENVLAGDTESAEKVLAIARKLSYWRNNRDRIMEQMVVWLRQNDLPRHLRHDGNTYGAIIPQVVVSGTLTRRAVEPTWMTASNAHPERIGSELRAMVQAPPGYNIVGADVDSQELWIASVIGDAHFAKTHGATPFGWMTLSGNKAGATDMHSVTAKAVGISRDHAKVINYARIYGAGQNFAEQLLKQFNPSMSESEARSKATKMFTLTKGKLIYYMKSEYLTDFADQPYSKWQAFEIAKTHGKEVHEMFLKPKWVGGTESAMFNRLEDIAGNKHPVTPFLNGRLSRALEPTNISNDKFLPTKVNWVVQSGAVDFLHLMLVCMFWILGDRARFCLSFHDEVRYLIPERYKYQAALAMHITNLLTRAFCSIRLGLDDLPQSIAFFSAVEVDTVLRKEATQDCKTPSNPHGLEKGYNIPSGENLNIYEAIEKAHGKYKYWYKERATKRKHVLMEVLQDDYSVPTENQQIVKIVSSRGNNLHEVETPDGSTFLISMPTKFRKNVWVKRGDFVLVEPIKEGDKVKAEMVRVLTSEHIKYFKQDGVWPNAFESDNKNKSEDDLFVNTNRMRESQDSSSSDDSDSDFQSENNS